MDDIFAVRELDFCRKEQINNRTAFCYYEIAAKKEFRNRNLALNYFLFVLDGEIEISCNEFERRHILADEMVLLPLGSSVIVKAVKKTRLYVMYFDLFMSNCDKLVFMAYLPYTEKNKYEFKAVKVPHEIRMFLNQLLYFQQKKVDCLHFNSLKYREFFILLRNFCSREDIVALMYPLIGNELSFRIKVIENYSKVESGRVEELAKLVGMGRKNFDKHFRLEFGVSPAKWMQQEMAKRLRVFLTEPGVTIFDAMDHFHFNSPSHFNRFCRRYFDQTPGEIIKEARHTQTTNSKNRRKQ